MSDSKAVSHRYDFALIFDVKNGNPNGDPDAGNEPRTDPETGHGLVSDVCLKRKIRNFVCAAKRDSATGEPAPGYDIYVKERAVLNQQHQRAYQALGLDPGVNGKEKASNAEKGRAWMCQTFFDIRMFGAVMTTDINCGQVRGPVQITFARSVDQITSLEQTITRKAVTTEREASGQIEKHGMVTGTMGNKALVPYGLYVAHGFISPFLAADTGFSEDDLALLWQALQMMFEIDRSASRGEMASRKLVAFEHESGLGNAPAHKLFERIRVDRIDKEKPARDYSDYAVAIDTKDLPEGIRLHELL